jgi:hypothetical protein
MREVISIPGGTIGVGGRVAVNFVPGELEPFYGTRTPAGFALYVRVRPKRMATSMSPAMATPKAAPHHEMHMPE